MRYYFHIRDLGRLIPDEEGMELCDMAEAQIEARLSAVDLAMAAMRAGIGLGTNTVEITDNRGNVLGAVAIRNAIH